MAFDITKVSKTDGDYSENGNRIYTYRKTDETLTALKTSAYFNTWENLKVYDIITLIGSDGVEIVYVSQIYVSGVTDAEVVRFYLATNYTIVSAGSHTTVGGGVTEDITLAGTQATDTAIVAIQVFGASPITRLAGIADTDKISLTFNADPSNDHVISYQVIRAT